MRLVLALSAAVLAGPVLAQSAEHDAATLIVGPMLQEVAPGEGGQMLTACVVANATAEELASLAAASGPTAEVGALVNGIVNRPETLACLQEAAGQ